MTTVAAWAISRIKNWTSGDISDSQVPKSNHGELGSSRQPETNGINYIDLYTVLFYELSSCFASYAVRKKNIETFKVLKICPT